MERIDKMIRFSNYGDLRNIELMFDLMSQKDREYLFYNGEYADVKFTELKNDIIKGNCIILKVDNETIGFLSKSLENNECVFIDGLYVKPLYRSKSFPVLLEVFRFIETMYERPIKFVIHKDNNRMTTLAKYLNAKPNLVKDNVIEYYINQKEKQNE
jgi:hypothetical protein